MPAVFRWTGIAFCAALAAACPALRAGEPSAEASELVEKAARLAESDAPADSFKAYQKASLAFDDVNVHRRIGRIYYNRAERLKAELKPQLEEAGLNWYAAREAALEERRSLVMGKFKRFNPNNPKYVEATTKYGDLLKRARDAIDLYANAQLAFTAVLRHSRHKDFEAAACQALSLAINNETHTRVRCRQLLVGFLAEYKPSSDSERALYARCKEELEEMNK